VSHWTLSEGITENASPWQRRTSPGAAVASLWFWHRRRSDGVRNCSPTDRLDLAPAGDGAVTAGVDLNPRPVIVACTCSSRSHDVSHDVRAALFTRRAEPDANTCTQRLPVQASGVNGCRILAGTRWSIRNYATDAYCALIPTCRHSLKVRSEWRHSSCKTRSLSLYLSLWPYRCLACTANAGCTVRISSACNLITICQTLGGI